jgi:DNA-binding response OmpR family regulator
MLVGAQGTHQVAICHDGQKCLRKARSWKPHVALLDIGMPAWTGTRSPKGCGRCTSATGSILIIAVTAWGGEDDRALSLLAGIDVHLTKPADASVLMRLIDSGPTCTRES